MGRCCRGEAIRLTIRRVPRKDIELFSFSSRHGELNFTFGGKGGEKMVWIPRAALILGMAAAGAIVGAFAVALLWNATQGPGAPEMPGAQGAVFGYLVGAPLGGAVGIVVGTLIACRWIGK
jgi:hypothetical protein